MPRTMSRWRVSAARTAFSGLAVCASMFGALALGVPAGAATAPHIVARPSSVMVNGVTTLTGTGFAARAKLTIAECSSKNWIAPSKPCDSDNAVSVVTDAHGRFTKKLEVELCPRVRTHIGPGTQTCYVGSPQPRGVDTITLAGAAAVKVTYP